MPTIFYCIPENTADDAITTLQINRSFMLEAIICKGNPTGKAIVFPSVVVTSSAIDDVILLDDQGQVTADQVQAATQNAITAEENAIVTEKANLDSAKSKLVSLGLTAD